ncbi:MAG TPA: winged helix-turn-helix domain-containing protein [Candidatus Bathyarchaeia archaeon]|nr:winged helix-turn-helix domain-containing protein [Candidatus Bathyarchaeia archaeon]
MRKSKLELYEDVLHALAKKPLTIDSIAYECNMDCVALRQRLDFLVKNRLVEEKNYKKKTVYALTRRGLAIHKTLTITRRLEKLQTTIKMIDEALQALPVFSEQDKETTRRTRRNENY